MSDGERPIPPRNRWLKRVTIAIIIVVVAYGVVRWRFAVVAGREYAQAKTELDEAVQPYLDELRHPEPLDPASNAAPLIREAADAYDKEYEARQKNTGDVPEEEWRPVFAARMYAERPEIFDAVRRGRLRGRTDWGITDGDLLDGLPHLQWRGFPPLAAALCDLAVQHARDGDPQGAVALLQDTVFLADAMNEFPALISHLVSLLISQHVADAVDQIAPGLVEQLRTHTATAPATREDLAGLVAALERDDHLQRGFELAIAVESTQMFQLARQMFDKMGRTSFATPFIECDLALCARYWRQMIVWAQARTLTEASRLVPQPPQGRSRLWEATHTISMFTLPAYGGLAQQRFTQIVARRMAAARLAICLYELDHGQRPASLDDLVPEYLTAVPRDPLRTDLPPIRYDPRDDGRLLSAGDSEADEVGTDLSAASRPADDDRDEVEGQSRQDDEQEKTGTRPRDR